MTFKREEAASSLMGPVEAFTNAWRKSFAYGGKATRAEYWWFYLINSVIGMVLAVLFLAANRDVGPQGFSFQFVFIYSFAQVFPSVSIVIRRLRDIGKKWTWIFINLIPFIGGLWFIYLLCQPSGRYEISQVS